jgi:hypothetical protein
LKETRQTGALPYPAPRFSFFQSVATRHESSSENRLEFRLQAVGRIIEPHRLRAELQTHSSFQGVASRHESSSENRLEFRLQAVGRIIEPHRLKAELQTHSSFQGVASRREGFNEETDARSGACVAIPYRYRRDQGRTLHRRRPNCRDA